VTQDGLDGLWLEGFAHCPWCMGNIQLQDPDTLLCNECGETWPAADTQHFAETYHSSGRCQVDGCDCEEGRQASEDEDDEFHWTPGDEG